MDLYRLLFFPLSVTWSPCISFLATTQKSNKNSVTKNALKDGHLDKFYKWFVGFSDAEGSFGIFPLLNSKTQIVQGFYFKFTVGLHKDDKGALNMIKSKLDMGKMYYYKDKQIFVVTKNEDINKLISIFNEYTLNTSKYLDFLEFKLAFTLFVLFS